MGREIYKECIRNHSAIPGKIETDGCKLFSTQSIFPDNCSRCGCNRRYHLKLIEVDLIGEKAPTTTNLRLEGGGGGGPSRSVTDAKRKARVLHLGASIREAAPRLLPVVRKNVKKGRRSQFTEAKRKAMKAYAERLGWSLGSMRGISGQREIQRFCDSIGVSKKQFKTWLNNNKRLRKKIMPSLLGPIKLPLPS